MKTHAPFGWRRSAILIAVVLAVPLVALPVGAVPPGPFSGQADGLALSLEAPILDVDDPPGFTAGVSAAEADSDPSAHARGAGDCEALAPGETLFDLPCTDSNTEEAEAPGAGQDVDPDPNPKCSSPEFPAEIAAVFNARLACGNAIARTQGGEVFAEGMGNVSRIDLTLADDLFPDLLETVAFSVGLGPTTSTVFSQGDVVAAGAGADGGAIGFFPTDLQEPDPLTNGLIIIDVGDSNVQTACDGRTGEAAASADPALVSVRFKTDATQEEYTEIALDPGETQTILPDTPFETTIVAADSTTTVDNQERSGSSTAQASAIDIHAVKGIVLPSTIDAENGGLRLRLAQTNAQIECALLDVPDLAETGDRGGAAGAAALLLGAVALALVLRPRLRRS